MIIHSEACLNYYIINTCTSCLGYFDPDTYTVYQHDLCIEEKCTEQYKINLCLSIALYGLYTQFTSTKITDWYMQNERVGNIIFYNSVQ